MKLILNVVAIVLVMSFVACGKKNSRDATTKTPQQGGPGDDVSELKYVPPNPDPKTPRKSKYLMSDYIPFAKVVGPGDEKRIYIQMDLLFQPSTVTGKSKTEDKYDFFYHEIITCKDGPEGALRLEVYHIPIQGKATRVKGALNMPELGTLTRSGNKKTNTQSANLSLTQPINERNLSGMKLPLNYGDSLETLETLQAKIQEKVTYTPDQAIAKIDKEKLCAKADKSVKGIVPIREESDTFQLISPDSPEATSPQPQSNPEDGK